MGIENSIMAIDYMNEYHDLIYRFYGTEYVVYPCTYFRLDYTNSIKEEDKFESGAYEIVGEYSGYKWHKIYMFPAAFCEPITSITPTRDERGRVLELTTSFVIPGQLFMQPLYNDLVIFPTTLRQGDFEKYPSYIVSNVERAIFSNETLYKVTVQAFHASETMINNQVIDEYIFVDYFKKIYPIDVGMQLLSLMNTVQTEMLDFYNTYFNKQSQMFCVDVPNN
ncbi:hypothetical protein M0R19_07630 [Candidatus Pacearchaeota archaeon]|jgi:hypothetical protein|nr:hypothetical protein [Candidatus Pacearchaeota archaeon]